MKKFLYIGGALLYTIIHIVFSIVVITIDEILDWVGHVYLVICKSPNKFTDVLKEALRNDK